MKEKKIMDKIESITNFEKYPDSTELTKRVEEIMEYIYVNETNDIKILLSFLITKIAILQAEIRNLEKELKYYL